MLRPYRGKNVSENKGLFNYQLSRARRFIERSFGILTNKRKIFHRSLNVNIDMALQPPPPPQSVSPTHHASFIVITTMAKDTSLRSTNWQFSVLDLYRIFTHVVHRLATKACRGSGGTAPYILKVRTREMRVLSFTLQKAPPQPGRGLGYPFPVTEFKPRTVQLFLLLRTYLSTETEKKWQQ
jgi:hypothetical protein